MGETRIIKRYANRKLYDTQRSRYVTLEQIAEMIRSGEDVQIVDNNSKDDLTSVTLTQIIFEEQKKKSFLPLLTLREIIQSGGQSIQQIATQAGEKVRAVFRREREDGTADGTEGTATTEEGQPARSLRDFLERSQQTFDEWQKRVDERIRHTIDAVSPFAGIEKEVRGLAQRLSELEKRLEGRG
jgi:polyhydroxyalkanoate synthesis repressor PhaR